MIDPLTREQTILALRIMITKLNAAIQSNTWTLETARILELAQDIGAWLDTRPINHRPTRGSDVEAWIKRRRNQTAVKGSAEWYVLDTLLDDYRDHVDTGTPLGREVLGPHDDN